MKISSFTFAPVLVGSAIAASSPMDVSANNTILQNLQALANSMNNSSVNYINLLLGMNTSCTSQIAQLLNSSDSSMNLTFFAPSDAAFNNITGWPDLGADFCSICNQTSSSNSSQSSGGASQGGMNGGGRNCSSSCNSTALDFNATASQLAPCIPEILQYHVLNQSLYFNETTFGFLNRSSSNITVLPTYLNSSCLVHLTNSSSSGNNTGGAAGAGSGDQSGENSMSNSTSQSNNQFLVFNITKNNDSQGSNGGSSMNSSSPYNVSISHGINIPANVTVFDIQSSNGVLHIIDALLIPPANMSQTLNYTFNSTNSTSNNSSSGSSALFNQTELSQYYNMSGITIFLPDPESAQGQNMSNGSFNVSDYVFPELIFNNQSFLNIGNLSDGVFLQQNYTNINGQNVTLLFGRNYSVLINGTAVTRSNILMDNGVMHLLNATQLQSSPGLTSGQGILSRLSRFLKKPF